MNLSDKTKYEILLMNIERIPTHMFDNLGQHSIAAYLETKGFKAMVYSGIAGECKKIISESVEKDFVPVIGFYIAEDNLSVVSHIIKWVKNSYNVYTVAGGPQAVALKKDFLLDTKCDFVVEGEGEIPDYQLLCSIIDNIIPLENVNSLRYIDSNGIYHENPLAQPFDNLDDIPFPSQKRCIGKEFRNGNSFGIITGRGCPFNCAFCYEGANTKNVRLRSIDNVIAEIDFALSENKNLKYLNVFDDTFTLDFKRVNEFCEKIKEKNLLWYCEGHTSNIVKYPDMIKTMVNAGMIGLQIGIESGSDDVLKAYNKHTNSKMLLDVVKICKKAGLTRLVGNFIVGGANETEKSILESMTLAEKMIEVGAGMFECKTVFLAPYPHTAISRTPEKFNLEYADETDELTCIYSMQMPLMKPSAINYDRLIELKLSFDKMINQKIQQLSAQPFKSDVERNFYKFGKRFDATSIWKENYLRHEHIVSYLEGTFFLNKQNTDIYTDEELAEKYTVRTFNLVYEKNGILKYENFIFNECESFLLKYSSGKLKFQEIVFKSKWNFSEMINAYRILNKYCLIYASDF